MVQNPHPAPGAEGSQGRTASQSLPHRCPSHPSRPCQPFFVEAACTVDATPTPRPDTPTRPAVPLARATTPRESAAAGRRIPTAGHRAARIRHSGRRAGGNCSIRAATRRRHAVAMRLMVQNPHPPAGIPPPRAADSPTLRGGMNRIGRRTGIVGVSIGFRTPNHPGRSAPGRCSTPDRRPLARRAAHKPPRITPTRMPPRRFARQ